MIETPNWNRDKFGETIEQNPRYFHRRENTDYQPIEGESLAGYCRRLMNSIKKLEDINTTAHIYGRKTWYTHKTPSTCWICDEINVMWYIWEMLNMTSNLINGENYIFRTITGKLSLIPPDK